MTFKKECKLYEFISAKKDVVPFDIKIGLKWSNYKTVKYLKRLLKGGLIKKDGEHYKPKSVEELINWDEMKHIKKQ